MKTAHYVLSAFLGLLATRPPIAIEIGPSARSYEGSESLLTVVPRVDVTCILRSWRIVGVDVCVRDGTPRACVIIENAYPVGILEAVRRPLTSHLLEIDAILKILAPLVPEGFTSSHTTDTSSGSGLQFTETRVFEFVPQLPLLSLALPLVIPPGNLFAISYLSELDAFGWRNGWADMLLDPEAAAEKAALPACSLVPRTGDCAWSWGSYFPRTGFLIHPSEVMAAHLSALRAGRVGAHPPGRVVIAPYTYEPRTGHYVQLVRPTTRPCVPIGWPVTRSIEAGTLSQEGAYLMIHFGIFRECRGCWGPTLAPARPPGS